MGFIKILILQLSNCVISDKLFKAPETVSSFPKWGNMIYQENQMVLL